MNINLRNKWFGFKALQSYQKGLSSYKMDKFSSDLAFY